MVLLSKFIVILYGFGSSINDVIYNINKEFITVDVYKHLKSFRSIDKAFIFSVEDIRN